MSTLARLHKTSKQKSLKTLLSLNLWRCLTDWQCCQVFRQSFEWSAETYGYQSHSNPLICHDYKQKNFPFAVRAGLDIQAKLRRSTKKKHVLYLFDHKTTWVTLLHAPSIRCAPRWKPARSPGISLITVAVWKKLFRFSKYKVGDRMSTDVLDGSITPLDTKNIVFTDTPFECCWFSARSVLADCWSLSLISLSFFRSDICNQREMACRLATMNTLEAMRELFDFLGD